MDPPTPEDVIAFLFLSPLWVGLLLIFREGRRLRYLGRPYFRSWRTSGTVSEHVETKLRNGAVKSSAVITFTSEWGSTVRYVEPPLRRGNPPVVGTEVRMCHRFGDEKLSKRYDRSRQLVGWLVVITSGPLLVILFRAYWPLLAAGGIVLLLNAIRRRVTGRSSSTVHSAFRDVAKPAPSLPGGSSTGAHHAEKVQSEVEQPLTSTTDRPIEWRFAGQRASDTDEAEVDRVRELTASLKPTLRTYLVSMVVLALVAGAVQRPFLTPSLILGFLFVGFYLLWRAQPFPDGRISIGHVVDHVAGRGSKGGTVYANTIEYETDTGPVRFTTSTSTNRRTPLGTERTVSYRPYDLSQARCTNGIGAQAGWLWTIFSAVMGVAFNWMVWPPLALVAAVGAWILYRRYVGLLGPARPELSTIRSPLIS